eukprot:TRINITY_DN91277_c0_g1_i1.p1 TRINITY_DN91277_c0_g1~~TRINITY_DN91277_c0_g1_i1.p1  ORF type:complete len:662 (+),score=136.12 TRINITY_DN91277_c0_g1_i1:77-2062(+)
MRGPYGVSLIYSLIKHMVGEKPLKIGFMQHGGIVPHIINRWQFGFGYPTSFAYVTMDNEAEDFDVIVQDVKSVPLLVDPLNIEDQFSWLKPGGMFIFDAPDNHTASQLAQLIDVLNRGCFDDDHLGPLLGADHLIKAVLYLPEMVALVKQGATDEVDYLTLGDYGRAYGEGRQQITTRLRFWEIGVPPKDAQMDYFLAHLDLYELDLHYVQVYMVFRLQWDDYDNSTASKPLLAVTPRGMDEPEPDLISEAEFAKQLRSDLHFALAVHEQRINVRAVTCQKEAGLCEVEVRFLPAAVLRDNEVNFKFHRKIKWKDWKSYFRHSRPQPLHVIAQSFREKAKMTGDDLSDFYTGSVTRAAIEDQFHVQLFATNCSGYEDAVRVHTFECIDNASHVEGKIAPSKKTDKPTVHSPLYHLFAKEKLDCCIGRGAFGGLFEQRVKNPDGHAVLVQDGEIQVNGRELAVFHSGPTPGGNWAPSEEKTAKVSKALDKLQGQGKAIGFVDDTDCLRWTWDLLWPRLRAGGLYAFEQDGCYGALTDDEKFIAPPESVTGLARKLAMGAVFDSGQEVEMVVAHKNLVVVQKYRDRSTGRSPNSGWVHGDRMEKDKPTRKRRSPTTARATTSSSRKPPSAAQTPQSSGTGGDTTLPESDSISRQKQGKRADEL